MNEFVSKTGRPLLIDDLEIPTQVKNALIAGTEFRTVEELCRLSQQDLTRLPGIGRISLEQIKEALAEKGHWLGQFRPDGSERLPGS